MPPRKLRISAKPPVFPPKKTMQVSLALEEMLTVIIQYCMGDKKGQFIDIRIVKLNLTHNYNM